MSSDPAIPAAHFCGTLIAPDLLACQGFQTIYLQNMMLKMSGNEPERLDDVHPPADRMAKESSPKLTTLYSLKQCPHRIASATPATGDVGHARYLRW